MSAGVADFSGSVSAAVSMQPGPCLVLLLLLLFVELMRVYLRCDAEAQREQPRRKSLMK